MKPITLRREPKINAWYPIWWHHHGSKMRLASCDLNNLLLVIEGSAASVRISRRAVGPGWILKWEVRQSQIDKVNGVIQTQTDRLRAAFGLTDDTDESGDWLIYRYGAESASQGEYIRWERFLNIPCPGTGHDGDPNVSIEIDDEIREAVRKLTEQE